MGVPYTYIFLFTVDHCLLKRFSPVFSFEGRFAFIINVNVLKKMTYAGWINVWHFFWHFCDMPTPLVNFMKSLELKNWHRYMLNIVSKYYLSWWKTNKIVISIFSQTLSVWHFYQEHCQSFSNLHSGRVIHNLSWRRQARAIGVRAHVKYDSNLSGGMKQQNVIIILLRVVCCDSSHKLFTLIM